MIEAQGYVRYCAGRFVSVPALSAWSSGSRVEAVAPEIYPDEDLSSYEIELLLTHANYGCMSLICSSANRRHPFVFMLGRKYGFVPYAYLAYCHDLEDFVRFAGPLGRFLARRGFPLVVLDSNGPVRGLIGRYSANVPEILQGVGSTASRRPSILGTGHVRLLTQLYPGNSSWIGRLLEVGTLTGLPQSRLRWRSWPDRTERRWGG